MIRANRPLLTHNDSRNRPSYPVYGTGERNLFTTADYNDMLDEDGIEEKKMVAVDE